MPKKEEKKDERNDIENGGTTETNGGIGSGEESGSASGERGGAQGGKQGSEEGNGVPNGGSEGSSGGSEGTQGGSGEDEAASRRKALLQRILSQGNHGQSAANGAADGTNHDNHKGNGRKVPKSDNGNAGHNSVTSRTDSGNEPSSGQSNDSLSSSSETVQRTSRGIKEDKPQGVNVKGVDKIKQLAAQATKHEAPKLKFHWDEKPLTNKEGDEMLPKVKGLLEVVFRSMDKGISMTNRERAEAHIWSMIDSEDIEIIASHLVEMAKGSKVVATVVRRMTNSYRLLQIGVITLPRFIQTYQFYMEHGGFMLGGLPNVRQS